MDYAAERLNLVNWLRKQMIGPVLTGELQGISPLRRYPMGVLYPTVETGEGIDPATEDDDFSDEDCAGAVENDSDKGASGVVR